MINKLMTISEAAEYLRCSKSLIYSLSHLKKIPLFKRGKALLFLQTELSSWVTNGSNKAAAERIISERERAHGVEK